MTNKNKQEHQINKQKQTLLPKKSFKSLSRELIKTIEDIAPS